MEDAAAQEIKEAKLEQVFLELRAQRGLEDPETLAAFFALFAEAIQLYHLNKIAMYIGDVMPICRARADSFKVKAIQSMAFLLFKQSRQVGGHLGPPRSYLCVLSTSTACTLACAVGRFQEALDHFKEMEKEIGSDEPALCENMGLVYALLCASLRPLRALRLFVWYRTLAAAFTGDGHGATASRWRFVVDGPE